MPSGSVLRYVERLRQLALDQADDLQPALDRIMESNVVGSPTDIDFRAVSRSVRSEDRLALWRKVQLNCLHQAVNVTDHARAVAMLLSQPGAGIPIYAHSTLARVSIESSTNIAYVHDRRAVFELRFARGIAFLIGDADAARRAADRVPANAYMRAPGPAVAKAYDDLLALIARARIEIVPNRSGNPKGIRVSLGAAEAHISVKMTELVHDLFPNMPGVYNFMSGVTHGMPWMLRDNARVANRRAVWDADPLDVGGSVLAVMNAAHTMLAAHAWHRGLEDDPSVARSRDRVAAVDQAMQLLGRAHITLPRAPVAPFHSTSG